MSIKQVWTHEKMKTLRKLADLSSVYRPNGVPLPRKDWAEGMNKLKNQDFAAYKILKPHSIKSLKWIWSKYQNVAYGFCATTTCSNTVEPDNFYCKVCKPNRGEFHRGVFSKPFLLENMDTVVKTIAEMKDADLKNLVIEGMSKGQIHYSLRKVMLGDKYVTNLSDKNRQKKKK